MLKKITTWFKLLCTWLCKPFVWCARIAKVLLRPLQSVVRRVASMWQMISAPCVGWWSQREARERKLIKYGGSGAIIFIIYITAWLPLTTAVQQQTQLVEQNTQLVTWMHHALPRIQEYQASGWNLDRLPSSGGKKAMDSFLQQLKVSLSNQQLSDFVIQIKLLPQQAMLNFPKLLQAKQVQPLLQIYFRAVPFALFEQWLQKFSKQQHIALASLQAVKSQPDGTANLVLALGV